MRFFVVVAAALALAACAASGSAPQAATENSPFPVARGTASPPPMPSAGGQAAPPQGQAPRGVDFGQWRSADPAVYGPALQAQLRQRYAGKSAGEVRTDLEANGFACENEGRLDCRIEIFERQCAHDWYVVLERGRAEPVAGYDVMCLGAR
jgi:hypothetical protein